MAEWYIAEGDPLPRPKPRAKDKKAAFQETIPLRVRAHTGASP
jgi:hypothetical protein